MELMRRPCRSYRSSLVSPSTAATTRTLNGPLLGLGAASSTALLPRMGVITIGVLAGRTLMETVQVENSTGVQLPRPPYSTR